MKRDLQIRYFGILVIILTAFFAAPSGVRAAAMNDYCQVPPFVTTAVSPNVMLAIDVSGSMGWSAYQQASDRQRYCSLNTNISCNPDHYSGGVYTDCTRNWGTCVGSGHDKQCSIADSHGHYQDCNKDSDCSRNWGACTSVQSGLYYGTCSSNETKGCNLGPTSSSASDCYTSGSCKCGVADGTCVATQTYEGYFTPDNDYLAGFCSTTTSTACDASSDCPSGETCNYINGYCSNDGSACTLGTGCTGGGTCRPTYYSYIRTGSNCSALYTYPCSSSTNSCPGHTTTKPANSLNTCPANKQYYCASNPGQPSMISGDCGTPSAGNWLNFLNMTRIDLLRWAMTGGSPATCNSTNAGTNTGYGYCDPRVYKDSGMSASGKIGTVCSDTLQLDSTGTTGHGCILRSYGISGNSDTSVSVAVPWTGRIDQGLAFQFDLLPVKPRMGAYFFSGTGVKSNYVYIGDFTQSSNTTANYHFQNLITQVNSTAPGGTTPTGPAMWDILNYFKQVTPQYGGIDASNNASWKSPMYDCSSNGAGANCNYIPCAKNFVLLMSDGMWNTPSCSNTNSSADTVVPAYTMHMGFHNAVTNVDAKISSVYTVGMFVGTNGTQALENSAMYGSFDSSSSANYVDAGGTHWPGGTTGYPNNSCSASDGSSGGSCSAQGSLCNAVPNPSSTDWDTDAVGSDGYDVPDTFYTADDALSMRSNIMDAVLDMLAKVTSGTAASVLASGEGSGANIAQAIYYPRRSFYTGAVDWAGGLQNFWYFVDPQFVNSNIREEGGTRDYVLDILADNTTSPTAYHQDYILQFYYDSDAQKAKARRFYGLSNGGAGAQVDTVDFESLGNLWEAGKLLWAMAPSARTIFTTTSTAYPVTLDPNPAVTANKFSLDNLATLRPYLNTDLSAAAEPTKTTENNQLATNLINWVRGTDFGANFSQTYTTGAETYRQRTVSLTSSSGSNVWKLGDIIDSTPRISSWVPIHYYDKTYGDSTYYNFTNDIGSTLASDSTGRYRNRGMIFVGSNDGMLHAFKLGRLGLKWKTQTDTQKATLKYCAGDPSTACASDLDCPSGISCTTDTDLGTEEWAFIPKSVLPYLKYLKDDNYCHLYTVDLTPYILDASIGVPTGCTGNYWTCPKDASTWRTVLIGGMRYGGACRGTTTTCTDVNGDGLKDCVNTPADVSVSGTSTSIGYSTYFALDVTDPYKPKLMWEFSNPQLGFTTTGPAIVRINNRTVSGTSSAPDAAPASNGRWFVVLGSGSTGPIETNEHQFMGRSDQDLNVFILDLKTGQLVRQIDTGIQYAFAGSMLNSTHDSDLDYQDDALYIGYTKKCTTTNTVCTANTWSDGGVLRILTREDLFGSNVAGSGACSTDMTALNPNCWVYGRVLSGIGPVSSSVVRLQEPGGNLWLYAGTGRYYFKTASVTDDAANQRNLIGVKDPCFANGSFLASCMTTTDTTVALEPSGTVLGLTDLDTVNLTTTAGVTATKGWNILLDPQDTSAEADAERVVTDPLSSVSGLVYFTTFKPFDTPCKTGGTTALWAVKYNTAEAGGALLKGKALIQVSTGSIEQVDLRTAFTQRGNRKTVDMQGVPPSAQGLSLISAPPPVKRVLHMKER